MRRRNDTDEELVARAHSRLRQLVDEEAARFESDLQRTISLQRAEFASQAAEEHRKLSQERRDEIVRAEQRILTELSGRLIAAQKEFEGKLSSWTQDLERLREGLATQHARLEQRQRQLITEAEARFTREN